MIHSTPFVISGSVDNDILDFRSSTTPVHLKGLSGDDLLLGGAGDDILEGGQNDYSPGHGWTDENRLVGGAGNDVLNDGNGPGRLCGGTGEDTFIFEKGDIGGTEYYGQNTRDHIIDFEGAGHEGGDVLRFEGFPESARLEFDHLVTNHGNAAIYAIVYPGYYAEAHDEIMIQFADGFDPATQDFTTKDYIFLA